MPVENLSSLLSRLEAVIDIEMSATVDSNGVVDPAQFNNRIHILRQKLKEHTLKLRQEIERVEINQANLIEAQKLLTSLVTPLPIAIAVLDQEMCYLAASDRWLKDYQLKKSQIGSPINQAFSDMPKGWQQKYQECLEGKTQTLDPVFGSYSWEFCPWYNGEEQIAGVLIISQLSNEESLLQKKLQSCEAQMRAVFAGMKELVFTLELNSKTILVLPTKFFDLYNDIVVNKVIEQTQEHIFNSSQSKNYQTLIKQTLQTQQTSEFEYSIQLDNSLILFSVNIAPVSKNMAILVARDITCKREAEQNNLFAEKELAQVTLQSIGDAVITTDITGKIKYINPVAEYLTGWEVSEARKNSLTNVFQVVGEQTQKPIASLTRRIVEQNQVCQISTQNILIDRDGAAYNIEGLASPIKSRQGELIGIVIVFRDVTQARRMALKLSWQATHDSLTKLLNRRKFEEYVINAIEDSNKNDSNHAICLLDLDRFKIINDTCGHAAGDELLRQITKLLKRRVRTSDIFARVGGDEFGLLFRLCSIDVAQTIAEQLRQQVEDFRFIWEDKTFRFGISIGLVAIQSTTENIASLLSTADAACYAAKEKGGNCVYLSHEEDTIIARQKVERQWIEHLTIALDENRFCLYAQKIVAVDQERANNHGCHYEVLLRLIDDTGSLISPGEFLPAAERYGLMPAIDRWVIHAFLAGYEVYEQTRQINHNKNNFYTINLSGASINSPDFGDFLQNQFEHYQVSPSTICFEITETVAIANLDDAVNLITQLKELGCLIALDDFGSGMSSLNYLKNLPIDYLKIDGSFVTNIANDKIDYATVECFSHISQIMDIKTIAEFVENQTILQNLKQIGIDYAQGYGIEKPKPLTWA